MCEQPTATPELSGITAEGTYIRDAPRTKQPFLGVRTHVGLDIADVGRVGAKGGAIRGNSTCFEP